MNTLAIRSRLLETHKGKNSVLFGGFLIMISLSMFMAMDMYLPSLPHLSSYYHISATAAQLTITVFIVGLVFAALIYGPLSDAFGRRKVVLTGLSISLMGSLLCLLASNIDVFYSGRLLQGIGIAACITVPRSMMRDQFEGKQMAVFVSYLSIVFGVAPILMPILGGYLQHYFNWHVVFMVIMGFTLLMLLLVVFFLPETNRNITRQHLKLTTLVSNYKRIILSKSFTSHVLCSGIIFGGVVTFAAVSSFMIQKDLGYSAIVNSWVFVIIGAITMLAKYFNTILLRHFKVPQIIRAGLISAIMCGALMIITGLFFKMNLLTIIVSMTFFSIASGLVMSNATVAALKEFASIAGVASSFYGCVQLLLGFTVSLIGAHLAITSLYPLGIMFAAIAIAVLCYYAYCFRYNLSLYKDEA